MADIDPVSLTPRFRDSRLVGHTRMSWIDRQKSCPLALVSSDHARPHRGNRLGSNNENDAQHDQVFDKNLAPFVPANGQEDPMARPVRHGGHDAM